MYVWHGNSKIISSMLILGSVLFHIVCVAFYRAELKADVKQAGRLEAHMSGQLWLFKLTGRRTQQLLSHG